MEFEQAFSSLLAHKGFGIWSVSIFLLFNLRNADVFPHGDVTIQKAIHQLYGVKIDRKKGGAEDVIAAWSPYCSVASLYLWEWIDNGSPALS